jgi:hypothetical protein
MGLQKEFIAQVKMMTRGLYLDGDALIPDIVFMTDPLSLSYMVIIDRLTVIITRTLPSVA